MDGFPYDTVLALWEGIEANWIDLITAWNISGVRWREFSIIELLWIAHTGTLQGMKASNPKGVRMYLTQVRDYTALREWDKAQLKDK